MALLNIGAGNKDDAFYRYKMPRLITKIEGRGNGIKTNLVNMVDVAKALGRPPSYTTKFFGCELGAQSKFDEKTGTSIVNGSHDNHKLVALLEIFIKKYVQCYGCGNPETEILISKSQMITMKCAACGFASDVDMRDKLTTFILKNPPEQKKGGKDKKAAKKAEKEKLKDEPKKKKGQDEHHVKKKNGASDEEHSPSASQVDGNVGREDEDENGDDDDVEWLTDTSALAAQMRIKEQLTAATSEMVMQLPLEEDIASAENGSSKKVAKGKKNSKKADKSAEQDNLEENVKKMQELSIHDKLMKEFEACLKEGSTASELASKLQSKDEDIQEVAMIAYFAALFEGVSKGLAREVPKKKLYLANAAADAKWQAFLLKAIEAFCNSSADLGNEFPLVMKLLYDEDILEEEQILSWYDNGAATESGPARKNVEPFIVWLRTAESESEEEEEEED